MDPQALATLRAVRTHGGVTAAAAVRHLTPSAVSQQIAVLQREVGVPLTQRVGRGLRLTPAGDALADAALDVAVALERARAACDAFAARPQGTVTVSAFASGAQMLLPGLLTRVARLDGVEVRCVDEDVAQDAFAALTDRIDVVVAHRPDRSHDWGPGVRVVPLLREPLDVAVPLDHPLADRDHVAPADLADARWIAVREGFPVATVLAAVAAGTGAAPTVVHRINDFHVAEALVEAGHGVSLLPRWTTRAADGVRLRLLPLVGVRAGRRIDALVRADRAERLVVRTVVDELVAHAAGIGAAGRGGTDRGA
ncbi:LysR family transcriptional regulator [Cellulomonas oligotrophica]|uniref:DNA-binding transcriptional LysR family regulator n=1 Tax=Cellulomonas oligotrophica TaxID=931536 RepID=A0A7Y9FH56_9CELL|nr:LysR family transcriptional regulator [Cellulomonas oligotrophica]NYD87165.1 DNA-binding transcriptional LysR family regulator [Cellulomonas oligotrophica]GIG32049.1 LysR family transcriptional regulator [Cellulomonas oligotrophica]